jgi:hypothetical protein
MKPRQPVGCEKLQQLTRCQFRQARWRGTCVRCGLKDERLYSLEGSHQESFFVCLGAMP